MAKKQTRRTISVARNVYEAATTRAAELGISTSEWITRLIREQIPELPRGVHFRDGGAHAAVARMRWAGEPVVLHVPNATSEPPPPKWTREDLDAIAAARNGIPTGTHCANCIDAKATHYGRIDRTSDRYALCDDCELPADDDMRRTA